MLTADLYKLVGTPALAAEHFLTEGSAHSAEWLADRLTGESLAVAIQNIFPLSGEPSQVMTPVLVVAGQRDAIFGIDEEKATARVFHGNFALIPDQGHNLMMERDWQLTAAQIRGWFASLPISTLINP